VLVAGTQQRIIDERIGPLEKKENGVERLILGRQQHLQNATALWKNGLQVA
jgi:hypothetical protein